MALIVQTAAGVADADSYISVADAKTLAASYGWTLADTDAEIEEDLRTAMIYIESKRYRGDRQTAETSFPRDHLYRDNFGLDPIPAEVPRAQVRLASYANAGEILPKRSEVKRFRLEGVYSQELRDPDSLPSWHDVDALLGPLTYQGRPLVGRV